MGAKALLSDGVRARLERIQVGEGEVDLGRFPRFLVTGPQRTASTWVYYNLKRHPQIFLPVVQEVFYFSTLGKPEHEKFRYPLLQDYLAIMEEPTGVRLKKSLRSLFTTGERYTGVMNGEVTPSYAALEREVIEEVVAIRPEMKAIVMLRHPVERAISHATKDLVRRTKKSAADIPADAWKAFLSSKGQVKLARYATMIENWRACLQPGNLYLGDFCQISEDPEALLGGVHQFLGVRSGPKYCLKYAREQINANPVIELPDGVEAFLRELLAEEVDEYERLVAEVRAGRGVL